MEFTIKFESVPKELEQDLAYLVAQKVRAICGELNRPGSNRSIQASINDNETSSTTHRL